MPRERAVLARSADLLPSRHGESQGQLARPESHTARFGKAKSCSPAEPPWVSAPLLIHLSRRSRGATSPTKLEIGHHCNLAKLADCGGIRPGFQINVRTKRD